MTVVTTGMHDAGNAGDTHPFLREILWPFLHGQGVYICPEQQRRTGPAAFQDSGDAPFFDGLEGNMPAVQLFSNICQRFCFLPGKFRVFVTMTTDFDEQGKLCFDECFYIQRHEMTS